MKRKNDNIPNKIFLKNTILLTVIAIATLLVAVVGATFAYFTNSMLILLKMRTLLKKSSFLMPRTQAFGTTDLMIKCEAAKN